jgi:intracellular sulfur oxidation DsrE/DsrF family protein
MHLVILKRQDGCAPPNGNPQMRKHLFSMLVLALGFFAGSANIVYAEGTHKAVYHVNYYGAKHQTSTLINIQNHINAIGKEELDLIVVLHGDGLSLLMYPDAIGSNKMSEGNAENVVLARIEGLKQQGVKFQICRNTIAGRGIDMSDLYDVAEEDIVPSGVAQIAILQSQGYAYLKP